VRVDGADEAPLRRLIGNDLGGGQSLKELPEPGVAGLERAELLEQVLGGPVAGVAEHVPLDARAQARRAIGPGIERGVQHPQAVQEGHEPVGLECEAGEIEVPGDLAPGPLGYLSRALAGPQHVLDRVAGRGIQRERQFAHQDPLCRHREAGVRQGGEAAVDALALGTFALARRFRQAESHALPA
jgi:hypothetical protein